MQTVNFWGFDKKANSTARPATNPIASYQCDVVDGSGLLNPTIKLHTNFTSPIGHTYAYIPDWQRYYFIRGWRYDKGLWWADLTVDVLATYKPWIGDHTGYVLRSSAAWDGNIKDTFYPTKTNISQSVKIINLQWADQLSDGRYVVGIVSGGTSNTGSVNYYVMTSAQFNTFCNAIYNNDQDWMDSLNITDISTELLKVLFNPMEYVVSVMWYPFTVPAIGQQLTSIPLGWWQVPAGGQLLYSEAITFFDYTVTPDQHPQAATRGAYLNTAPYTTLTLDFQPFGYIPLDSSLIMGNAITLNVYVDYISGTACLHITCNNGSTIIYSAATQVGVPIQITGRQPNIASMIAGGVSAAVSAMQTQQAPGLLGDLQHVARGLTTGMGLPSIGETVGGIASAASTGLKRLASVGSNGSRAQILEEAYLVQDFMLLTDEDNAMFGRPLYSMRKISTIPGFIQLGDADISISCMDEERSMIYQFLKTGFFYE